MVTREISADNDVHRTLHNRVIHVSWAGFLRPKENVGTLSTLSKERLLRVQIASDHECENTENKKTLQDFRGDGFYCERF